MMDETSGWAWATQADVSYLLHTSDGGKTWANVTPQTDLRMYLHGYADDELDAQTAWMLLGAEKLVQTLDGGQTWNVIHQNFQDELVPPYPDWYALHFVDAKHGWLRGGITAAGAREYFYETQDGGVTWQPANFETLPDGYQQMNSKNEIAFWIVTAFLYYDPERFIIMSALDEQQGTVEMFLSTDWGDSWKTVPLPSSESLVGSLDTIEEISQPVFFGPQQGVLTVTIWDRDGTNTYKLFVYGTSDGGQSWKLTAGPSTLEGSPSAVSFLTPLDAMFVCGIKLCVSQDGGGSWRALDPGIEIDADHADIHFDFLDPATGWLLLHRKDALGQLLDSRLFKTTDGGVTWTELSPVLTR
jgi:photosystem II stability/assembly factor-like uncharacterized protein